MSGSPDLAQAWAFLEESDLVVPANQVDAGIHRVAEELHARLGVAYPLVLVVMSGAVVFAGRLLPLLRFPLDLDYLHASRYGSATQGREISWRMEPPESVRGRTVVVVDDILDGGETLAAIRDRLMSMGALQFFSAVLVSKSLNRQRPVEADFVGLEIPDRFVFGCGMDAKGYWRNLPEIRAMKGT